MLTDGGAVGMPFLGGYEAFPLSTQMVWRFVEVCDSLVVCSTNVSCS